MSWLVEPSTKSKGNDPECEIRIHSEDNILPQVTWQTLIDTFVASYGHDEKRKKFSDHIKDCLDPMIEDMWFEYQLCKPQIMKEIERR